MIFLFDGSFIPMDQDFPSFARRLRRNLDRTCFHLNCEDDSDKRIKIAVIQEGRGIVAAFWFSFCEDEGKVIISQDDWASLDDFPVGDLPRIIQLTMMPGTRTSIIFDDDNDREMRGFAISKHTVATTHAEMVMDVDNTIVSEWVNGCPFRTQDKTRPKGNVRKLNINFGGE